METIFGIVEALLCSGDSNDSYVDQLADFIASSHY